MDVNCVSKNVPSLTCYNLDKHDSIMIIFGTSVTEKVDNQNVLFSHLTQLVLLHYLGKQETQKVHLFTWMLHAFYQNTRNTLNITCLQLNHPLVSKRSTGCTRQDLESCCLLPTCYVLTKSLTVPVAACVKDGSYSSSSLSESQWTVWTGYLTISTKCRRHQTHHRW